MTQPSAIVGAGLSGLLAAYAWPNIPIFEAETGPRATHKALLRFRGDGVARLTGIDFRKVTVRKGIWSYGSFTAPDIGLANNYVLKTLGRLAGDRSIWDIDPVQRFIAPEYMYEQMLEAALNRIEFGVAYDFAIQNVSAPPPVISTAPMPRVIQSLIGPKTLKEEFHKAPIFVARFRIPKADVFQTIYFPDAAIPVYRASITGDLLIIESTEALELEGEAADAVSDAFSTPSLDALEPLDSTQQEFGKIIPLHGDARKHLLFRLTNEHNIYSLGRFACWRNILLDDVVDDIAVIKRLLLTASPYDAALKRARQ